QVRKIHARNEEDCAHGAPKGSERAVQFAGDVVFERHGNQTVFVSATRVGKFHAEVQVGRDAHGVIERLLQRHTWLQATDQGHDVAPVARFIEVQGLEKVHLRTGSESGAEIERLRQNAYHGDRLSIHIYFLADDGGVGIELPLPKRIGKQGDGMGAGAAVVRAKQVAKKGLHSKNLKEIADHHQ